MPKATWIHALKDSMIVFVLAMVAVFSICAGAVMLKVGLSNWGLLAWLHAHPGARGPGPAISEPEWGGFGLYVWSASSKAIYSFCVNLKTACPLETITNAQLVEGVVYMIIGVALLIYMMHRIHVLQKIRDQLSRFYHPMNLKGLCFSSSSMNSCRKSSNIPVPCIWLS